MFYLDDFWEASGTVSVCLTRLALPDVLKITQKSVGIRRKSVEVKKGTQDIGHFHNIL